MDKKKIIKSAMHKKGCSSDGKGGPLWDKVKSETGNIVSTVKGKYKKIKDNLQNALTDKIVDFVGDTPAGDIIKEGLNKQKRETLKNAIKAPSTPKKMPLNIVKKMPVKKDTIAEWEKKHPIKNTSNGVGVGY